MGKNNSTLYMMVDKSEEQLPLVVGTMDDICRYTGNSQDTVRSYMWHCKKANRPCRVIRLGKIKEIDGDEC